MNYEVVSIEYRNELQEHIIVYFDNDIFESFPVDENNPRYQQFLKDLEES